MTEQFSFPGFDDPPQKPPAQSKAKAGKPGETLPYSLFFSLFPRADDAKAVVELTNSLRLRHGLTGKPLLQHRLHVTLHDLGNYAEVPQDIVDAAIRAGDSLAADAFDVVFDCALSYPSGGTYVLSGTEGMRQLTAFRELLGEAMHGQGLRVKRSFTPHMTLMYDTHPVAEHAIEPVRWVAHEFVLIRSHKGLGKYDLMGSWSLQEG